MSVVEISNAEEFSALIDTNTSILIDFWAPWCGPCQALSPVFESLTDSVPANITLAKANVDELTGIAKSLGIRTIPTVVLLENGEIKAQSSGLVSKQTLLNLFNN